MARRTAQNAPAAWLYVRLSRDKAGASDSLAAQERKLRDRAAAEGVAVEEVFSEGAGRSAFGPKGTTRPEWERLVSSVRPGVVVMAVETSRFSRDTEDGLRQIRRIRASGGHVLTLDGNDSRLDASALPTTVRLAVAEEESRLKSERITRRKAAQRSAGAWPGRAPFGHRRRPDGRLELDPETAPIARRAVDLALAGKGAATIARTLNAEGVPGLRPGRPWSQMGLSALLRNPVLIGHGRHEGREVLGDDGAPVRFVEGPTIATPGEWARLRELAAERGERVAGVRRPTSRASDALLARTLRCGRCGAPMAASGPRYVCSAARSGKGCEGATVERSSVEPAVLARVLSHLAALDPEVPEELEELAAVALAWLGSGPEGAAARGAAEVAAAELAETERRLALLEEDFYLRGALPEARFSSLREALAARMASLRAEARSASPSVDVGPLLDLVATTEAMEAASPAILRAVVRAAVDSVTVAPAPYRGARWDASRVSVAWRS